MIHRPHGPWFILLAVVLLVAVPSVYSETVFDWGGSVDYLGTLAITPDADYNQELNAGLSLATYFSDSLTFKAKGTYSYTEDRPVYADVDHAWLRKQVFSDETVGEHNKKAMLNLTLGRFRLKEFSGYVFNHTLDGARVGLEMPSVSVSVGAGATGFTFMPSSSIIVTNSDYNDHSGLADDGYELSPAKLIGTLNVSFPSLALYQDLLFSVVAQQDLRRAYSDGNGEEELDTEYFGIGVQGRTIPSLYHDVYFFLNTGRGNFNVLGYLAGGEVRYYNRELLFSRIRLGGLYSSGDKEKDYYTYLYGGPDFNGTSSSFVPLSDSPSFGLVFSPQIGNITLGRLSYSMKPFGFSDKKSLESIQVELLGVSFFRSTGGIISNETLKPGSSEKYLGTEVDLKVRYRPFSDLGVSITGGLFFPNDDGDDAPLVKGDSPVRSAIQAQVSFSY